MSHISSKISNAHRYLIKSIFNDQWRKYADLSNPNGWIDIRSRTLYVVYDVRCVGENYRIQRNNLILRSRKARKRLGKYGHTIIYIYICIISLLYAEPLVEFDYSDK